MFTRNAGQVTDQAQIQVTEAGIQVTQLANAIAEANGTKANLVSSNGVVDHREVPSSLTVDVVSATHASGVDKTIYLFNEDKMNATPAYNSSNGTDVAGAITVTYKDGFSGKIFNEMLKGRGLKVTEITCSASVNSSKAADETFFPNAAMKLITADGKGNVKPYTIDWNEAISNAPNKAGIYTVKTNFVLHSLAQLSYNQSKDQKVSFVFKVEAF